MVDTEPLGIRVDASPAVIVFIHGFLGNPTMTWGEFPNLVVADTAFDGWDVFSFGYDTHLLPDLRNVWSADAGLDQLALYLKTAIEHDPFADYDAIAFVAHSMGGLIVQRALVDSGALANRTSHVFLYGSPSGGLRKAGWFRFFKKQPRDMDDDGQFVTDLRQRWTEQFGNRTTRPFQLWTVAGNRDEFVPAGSSLTPFDQADRFAIPGNHLDIVKPESANALGFRVFAKGLRGEAAAAGPWNSARVAAEMGDFASAIDVLLPHAADLDDEHLVTLALALDAAERRDDATQVLTSRANLGTDATGVLAGRLKRDWLARGTRAEADAALDRYADAYQRSVAAGDHAQAFYHGINVAFMQWVYQNDHAAARATATDVVAHCEQATVDHWNLATQGEANLYLGKQQEAIDAYRAAVALDPTPRELDSMYSQATRLAERLGDAAVADEVRTNLDRVFRAGEE